MAKPSVVTARAERKNTARMNNSTLTRIRETGRLVSFQSLVCGSEVGRNGISFFLGVENALLLFSAGGIRRAAGLYWATAGDMVFSGFGVVGFVGVGRIDRPSSTTEGFRGRSFRE